MIRSCFVALVAAVAAMGAVAVTSTASPTAPSGAAPPPGPGYVEPADEPVTGNYIQPSTPNLVDDVATSGTNGATGTWRYYKIQVPAGAASLDVDLRTSHDLDVRLPVAGVGRQRGLHRRHPGRRLVVRRRVYVRGWRHADHLHRDRPPLSSSGDGRRPSAVLVARRGTPVRRDERPDRRPPAARPRARPVGGRGALACPAVPGDHFAGVTVTADGPVGRLRIDREDGRSVIDYPLLGGLIDAAAWFDARGDVRVVVVESAARVFCSGFNVFGSGPLPLDGSVEAGIDFGRQAMNAVGGMRALTIAKVHGRARGGGVVLALACDLQVVAADAVLSLPEAHMGMSIPWATVPRLVRQLGPMRTKDLVLTAREFTGEQAGEWGLATEVVPADELDTAVDRLAEAVVTTPRLVVEQVLAEVDRLAEAAASTADAAPDIERMLAAGQDEGCRSARDIYLAQWRDRRAGGG